MSRLNLSGCASLGSVRAFAIGLIGLSVSGVVAICSAQSNPFATPAPPVTLPATTPVDPFSTVPPPAPPTQPAHLPVKSPFEPVFPEATSGSVPQTPVPGSVSKPVVPSTTPIIKDPFSAPDPKQPINFDAPDSSHDQTDAKAFGSRTSSQSGTLPDQPSNVDRDTDSQPRDANDGSSSKDASPPSETDASPDQQVDEAPSGAETSIDVPGDSGTSNDFPAGENPQAVGPSSQPNPAPGESNALTVETVWGNVANFWPYIAGVIAGILLLLWLLNNPTLSRGKKKNHSHQPRRVIDPEKSTFKKSTRFLSPKPAPDDDLKPITKHVAEPKPLSVNSDLDLDSDDEMSGLRLNESDILADIPPAADQSDLNFDEFDSTIVDADFSIVEDEIDDADFAVLMLQDDDEKVIVKTNANKVTDEVTDSMLASSKQPSDLFDEPEMADDASEAQPQRSQKPNVLPEPVNTDPTDESSSEEDSYAEALISDDPMNSESDEFDFLIDAEDATADITMPVTSHDVSASAPMSTDDSVPSAVPHSVVNVGMSVRGIGSALPGGGFEDQSNKLKAKFAAEKSELTRRVTELENELSVAQSGVAELSSIRSQFENAQRREKEDALTIESLNQQLEDLKAKQTDAEQSALQSADEARERLTQAQQKITELEDDLLKTKESAEHSLAELKRETEAIKQEAESEKNETLNSLESVQQELDQTNNELAKLQNERKESELVYQETSTEVEELKRAIDSLKAENETLTAAAQTPPQDDRSAQLEQERQLRIDTEAMLKEAEEQRTVVAIELRTLRKEVKRLTENTHSNPPQDTLEVEDLKKELDAAKATIVTLTQSLDDSSDQNGDLLLGQEKREIDHLKSDLASQDAIATRAQQTIDRLNLDLENKQTLIAQLQQSDEPSSLKIELESLKEKLQAAESTKVELEESNQRTASLGEELDKSRQELRDNRDSHEAIEASLKFAEAELHEKSQKIESLQAELSRYTAQSSVIETQKAEISKLTQSLSATLSGRTSIEYELSIVRKQLTEAQMTIAENETRFTELNAELKIGELATQKLEAEKVSLEQMFSQHKNEFDQLRASHQTALDKAAELERSQSSPLQSPLQSTLQNDPSPRETSSPPSQSSSANDAVLSKIEAALQQQTLRMNMLQEMNQQSLEKLNALQSAPSKRKSAKPKLPPGHDNLSEVSGIGPKFRRKLFDLGVKTIQEIALWTEQDVQSFGEKLGCGQRTAKQWSEKAKVLAEKNRR